VDRIRKALDLARLERAQGEEEPKFERALPKDPPSEPNPKAAATAIAYTRTRVFTPPAEVLERSRILLPGAEGAAAAAFRMLRTQVLQRMDANGWRSLAILSPAAADGKTTTAVNLAVSLGSGRLHTVLLVEFDFHRPTLAARFGLAPEYGVDGFDRLVILPARAALANSSEILAGPRGREVVAELRARYPERIIIFDLPPVLTADDALSFVPLVECGLVVAAEGRTRRNDLVRTIELLNKLPLVGTVLNRATDTTSSY